MRKLTWIIFWLLFALHHDFWWWNDGSIVLGFLPISLAWHIGFSIAAGSLWLFAIRHAWPSEIEAWADEPVPASDKKS
ncbi:hypothetical protein FEM03_03045 [Phragmitibacter flavus]|uniref:DUF3311 domain-containing protein n=1 Tax=Phragmitibacter flavus TaxID=2576071 RepID=A0A5R8KJB3_9BACT|nr:hypothetical protein [Phragmitibacter flavus]TLD72347.1 hypothetical protein FEM03_03045 [Phragmitibacter flavus]